MGTVVFDNVTKMYGDTVGIKDLSFDIRDEEFFVLVGPSGAGKTTTLKTVAGLIKPTSGDVYIDGALATNLKPEDRNVSMTFESYALYPHISVYDNIANPLRSPKFKVAEDIVDKEVRRVAAMLEIGHLLDRRPGELSGGQKQRVSLGRAMVRKPAVFLLDEPLSHVDAKIRHRMRVELNKLQRELQTTTIYVTHDYVEGLSLGDRVGVIRDGALVQMGKPKEMYHQPLNEFVATHIGFPEMNIFDAWIKKSGDALVAEVDGIPSIQVPLGKKHIDLVKKHGLDKIRLGFRGQFVDIVGESEGQFFASVYAFNPFITYGILAVEVGGEQFNILTEANRHFEIGERLSIRINPQNLYLFDVDTTTNLEFL